MSSEDMKKKAEEISKSIRDTGDKILKDMEGKFSDAEKQTVSFTTKLMSNISAHFHSIKKENVASFLLGVGGVTLAAGFSLIPGVGFIMGFFVGVLLNDEYRVKIKDFLSKSNDIITTTSKSATTAIQNNWDKFMNIIHTNVEKINEQKDYIESVAKDMEDHMKNYHEKK